MFHIEYKEEEEEGVSSVIASTNRYSITRNDLTYY